MTENEINITDMIKALQCVASQDADGDCYCDHFNAHLTCEQFGDNARLDEKHMSCGGILKDTQSCPYSQKTYGVCYEDGELWWLKDIVSILEEIQQYRAIGTIEEFKTYKQGDCMNNCEHYDNCANYIYSKGYNQGTIDRAEELQKCREYGYNKAIDDFAEKLCDKVTDDSLQVMFPDGLWGDVVTLDYVTEIACEIAKEMKGGANEECATL